MTLQDQKDLHESLVHELMANHSILTGLKTYAVNHFDMSSLSGSPTTNLQQRASERCISWLNLEYAASVETRSSVDFANENLTRKLRLSSEYRRYEDLKAAGQKDCLRGIRGCSTPMSDLVQKVPLSHVYKEFKHVSKPYQEAFKLLKSLFMYEPQAKAVVLLNSKWMVEWLAKEWELDFKIVWIHGELKASEKAKRADSFIRNQKENVLLGTKLATEGIDVRELKMVILVDYKPTIIEFLQAGGRLRTSGMLYVLLDPKTDFKREKSDIAPIDFTCPSTQISQFYGLPLCNTDLHHLQCCGSTNFLPAATEQLVLRVAKAATNSAYETQKDKDNRLTNNKRKAPDLPFFSMEKRRMRRLFHRNGHYTNIFDHMGHGETLAQCLQLNGISSHFWPSGTLIEKGSCPNCLKLSGLCVCPQDPMTYRQIACEALAVQRMVLDDEQYKKHLEESKPYFLDPVGYLLIYDKAKQNLYDTVRSKYVWFENLIRRKVIVAAECVHGMENSPLFKYTAKQIEDIDLDKWASMKEQQTEALEYFWCWEKRKCAKVWERERSKEGTSFAFLIKDHGTYTRLYKSSIASFHGPHYVQNQYYGGHLNSRRLYLSWKNRKVERIFQTSWDMYLSMVLGMFFNERLKSRITSLVEQVKDIRLIPHWMKLQMIEVIMADGQTIPFFMLCFAIHQEMES
ncbi:CRE_collapsed_G0044940.mRNA.1.CDS.1 [Saccharomyces cerevisiae]|nr:CRE_collapsed_G0044940.mRNA.1.CDS.1 [Saccharomyces cerevisiae]